MSRHYDPRADVDRTLASLRESERVRRRRERLALAVLWCAFAAWLIAEVFA